MCKQLEGRGPQTFVLLCNPTAICSGLPITLILFADVGVGVEVEVDLNFSSLPYDWSWGFN